MRLTQGLHRSLQQQPDAVATVFGKRSRTFAEHGERVARLAGGLRELGVGAGDRVGYLGTNSDHYLEYYLAVPWAGAVAVPVNSRWAPAEIAYSLRDSGTELLIVDDGFVGIVEELSELVPGLRTVAGAEAFGELVAADPVPDAETRR